jgi:hypothetical protein
MTRKVLSTAALTVLLVGSFAAQQGANVSGTWVLDANPGAPPLPAAAAATEAPSRLVIEQSPTDVRVNRQRRDGESDSVTYSFDPDQAALPVAAPDTATVEAKSAHAEWKDGRLMLLTQLSINGRTVTALETLTLGAGGRELIVETNLAVQHGYEAGAASSSVRNVYNRTRE